MTHAHTIRYEPPAGPTSPGICLTCGQDDFVGQNVVKSDQEGTFWRDSVSRGGKAAGEARKAKQTGWQKRRDQFRIGKEDPL